MILLLLILAPLIGAVIGRFIPGRAGEIGQLLASTAVLILAFASASSVMANGPIAFEPVAFLSLYLDAYSALMVSVIALVSWGGAFYAIGYLRHDVHIGRLAPDQVPNFYLWFHIFTATMIAVVSTDNLGLMWAAIEATTLASAMLVALYRTREAIEAAWKYLIICTVGISLALFGVLLLYAAGERALGAGLATLSWRDLADHASALDPTLVRLAFVFIIIGFGTKAGFAPLHTWLPDAHSQAPTPVSAVLSGVLLPCALYGIVRVHVIAVGALGSAFSSNLLMLFGLASAAVAVPFILRQNDLKRMLAYSSIEHIGIMAAAIGIGGPIGLFGGLLHMVLHGVGKATLFFAAGALLQRYGTANMLRMSGAVVALPASGWVLFVCGLALAGAPPFGLFVSEFSVITAGFNRGHPWVSVGLIACISVIFVGILFHLGRVALGRPRGSIDRGEGWAQRLLLGVPMIGLLVIGLWVPTPLANAIEQAAAILAVVP